MTSAYNQINRLRMQGWTWDSLARELGKAQGLRRSVARNTLRALQNQPHYNPGKALVAAVKQVHDRHNPSPFPAGGNNLISLCRDLMQDASSHLPTDSHNSLAKLASHVNEQLAVSQHPALVQCRLHWVMGNIHQFLMRNARLHGVATELIKQHQATAISHYTCASDFLDAGELPLEHYKIIHNLFVCHVNALHEPVRANHPELAAALVNLPYLASAKAVLEQEPFRWHTARNGLLFASLTQNRIAVVDFFEKLVLANPAFLHPDYKPLKTDSLLQDPSLQWAMTNVLTPDWIMAAQDRIQRLHPTLFNRQRNSRKKTKKAGSP